MRDNEIVQETESVLSYLCDLWLLPAHALRLARIRLAARRTEYTVAQSLEQELASMREAVGAARAMEKEPSRAASGKESTRVSDIELLRSSLARIPGRVAAAYQ